MGQTRQAAEQCYKQLEAAKEVGLVVNQQKTKLLTQSRNPRVRQTTTNLADNNIETVNSFTLALP